MGTVFACEQNGTVLTLTPLAKGSSKITFTVSDGTSTSDESLTVKVVSGKGIFYEKVGIYVLIAAIVIVIAVLIAIIISKNTRVKGTWMMTMQNAQGFTSQWEQPLDMTMLKIGKKKKFTLGELLNVTGQSGLNLFENNSALEEVGAVLAANADVRNILLKGVVAGKGCKLQNVPSSATVEVVCNGRPISGKAKMSTGSLTITVGQVGTEERVRLMMELVNNR